LAISLALGTIIELSCGGFHSEKLYSDRVSLLGARTDPDGKQVKNSASISPSRVFILL
jgi:hypothetical protein